MAAPGLADATVVGGAKTGLADPRVQAEELTNFCGELNRSMLPIAAISPAATARLTPVLVSSR
ncbi:hypothetical protein, partial [uncultured Jannaschia sp.]|uniref:hypothetical protein n=1 Tax=uncultured Jannaschia sp. TaxID=293347 RepID=UPI00261E0BFD